MTRSENLIEIQRREDEFYAFIDLAEDAPHKWGEVEQARADTMCEEIREMYDANDVADVDRIAGI